MGTGRRVTIFLTGGTSTSSMPWQASFEIRSPEKEWFIAESIALSMGIFSTLVMASFALGSPSFPFYSIIVLPIFIVSVPVVALVMYARRNRASGIALVGGSVLSGYSWLQFVIVPIGFGWGFIRLIVLMAFVAGSLKWILSTK